MIDIKCNIFDTFYIFIFTNKNNQSFSKIFMVYINDDINDDMQKTI